MQVKFAKILQNLYKAFAGEPKMGKLTLCQSAGQKTTGPQDHKTTRLQVLQILALSPLWRRIRKGESAARDSLQENGMSEAASSAISTFPGETQAAGVSELSQLCLPSQFKEPHRRLAWVNSICFLFLVIGLIGLRPPRVKVKPVSKLEESAPVLYIPPAEQPKVEPQVVQNEPEPQETEPQPQQVITVVAAPATANVAFAVPVPGAVAAVDPKVWTPPPPADYKPPQPVKFDPNASHGGSQPGPMYPAVAERDRHQGTVVIEFRVDERGAVQDAKVQRTSGFRELDEAALKVVKDHWRFPPGNPQWLYWPCKFVLQ
ncbi:MAG: hypothetical protein C5B50_08055 [Verrucomicrobia bacterium]|nr:MAG: hypothetical protein C5B50_08055 [Verrucomicrobiota bacterium]